MSLGIILAVTAGGIIVAYQAIVGPTDPTRQTGRGPEPSVSAVIDEQNRVKRCNKIKNLQLRLNCLSRAGYGTRSPGSIRQPETYSPPS